MNQYTINKNNLPIRIMIKLKTSTLLVLKKLKMFLVWLWISHKLIALNSKRSNFRINTIRNINVLNASE